MATEFRILGPLEVLEDGRPVDLGGQKQRSLLAVLLLHANEVVSVDRLIEAIWEDDPPARADKALQVYVSHLRKALGKERVLTRAPGYLLTVPEGQIDVSGFEAALAEERPRDALALWRGPPLSDFAYSRFAQSDIVRLEELRLSAVEARLDEDFAAGRHGSVIGELDALVRAHPLRERLRAQLMLALYRAGRQADALEAYQDARAALTEELGIEPGRELRELQQRILNQDPALDIEPRPSDSTIAPQSFFVGREPELAALRHGLNEAFAGHGRLFLLVGEPGIGKSRLADEVVTAARGQGATVLVGRCWEAGGAPAYWPWVQSLRSYVRDTPLDVIREQVGSGAADLAQLLPELGELVPPETQPTLDVESARFRLFDAVATFLRTASRSRPLVLFLDDLHAADEPSLLMLRYVTREIGDSSVLVLGAFRNVDPTPSDPLTEALAELGREPVTTTFVLTGLDEAEIGRVVELMTGERLSSDALIALSDETQGNPLFVSEIVRLLAAEGGMARAEPARLTIPQGVRDVINRRVRRLSSACGDMLVVASILGREFPVDALARIAHATSDETLDTLDEAMTERVVTDVPGAVGRLRFAHVLIRDTLYEGLTTARRVRLHRLALEALEERYGDEPGPHLAELAYHAIAGSDFELGARYAMRAGDRALELLAYEEAARLYTTAIEALDVTPAADGVARCELFLSLGEAESASDRPAAKRAYLEAAAIARRLGLGRHLARAAAGYGGWIMYSRAGRDELLVPLLEEGLAALDTADIELRVRLLARLSGALRDERARTRRDRLSMEALELARAAHDPVALAYALDGRAAAIMAPDTMSECLELGTELRDIGKRIGNPERVIQGHWARIMNQVMLGDVRGAESDMTVMSTLVDGLGSSVQLWQVAAARAMFATAAGDLDVGEEQARTAFDLGERAQPEMAIGVFWMQQFTLRDLRGDFGELHAAFEDLTTEYSARPVFGCVPVYIDAATGRTEPAKQALAALALEGFSTLPFDMEWLFAACLLAETSHMLSDTTAAATLYDLLAPWAPFNAANHPEGIRGSVARYLGQLATTMEQWDEAQRHFDDALARNADMGFRPWLALTQADYARMLIGRGASRDAPRARELLAQAHATYRELGLYGPLRRAEEAADR